MPFATPKEVLALARWIFRKDHEATGKSDARTDSVWTHASNWQRDRYVRLAQKLLRDPPEVLVRACKEKP